MSFIDCLELISVQLTNWAMDKLCWSMKDLIIKIE